MRIEVVLVMPYNGRAIQHLGGRVQLHRVQQVIQQIKTERAARYLVKAAGGQGCLYIVATPIGNLGDMVPRAIDVLQAVNVILAEDTRHSRKLLQHFAIGTPMQAYHDHSSPAAVQALMARLLAGETMALISDAGTPLISDPGFPLVKLAQQQGVQVIPVPGACAAIAALSASGLPSDHFWFEGFLPAKASGRRQRLAALTTLQATLVFYEAPHRIVDLFADLLELYGPDRLCCMARELSKQFETIKTGSIQDVQQWISSDSNQQKGEFVILVAAQAPAQKQQLDADSERILRVLLAELSVKQASSLAAKITGVSKRALYEWALQEQSLKS